MALNLPLPDLCSRDKRQGNTKKTEMSGVRFLDANKAQDGLGHLHSQLLHQALNFQQ